MAKNQLEKDIISLYDSNLVNLFSINQIATKLKKKYPYINKKVTDLINNKILNKIIVGKSYLCSLNFNNPETILLLSLQELKKKKTISTENINNFIEKNQLNITIHSIIKYNSKLLFVIENLSDRRKIQREFIDCLVADKKEFLDLLSEEKKLFTNHTILYGAEKFFELLKIELNELKRLYSPLNY
ncbi:hypothetical protein HN415_09750 [Candidatus Woesearchaeota archaeon]|nr:hypothetical protein [Candidatus Woesearchaeota archaeon]